jgi:hypothetical protein
LATPNLDKGSSFIDLEAAYIAEKEGKSLNELFWPQFADLLVACARTELYKEKYPNVFIKDLADLQRPPLLTPAETNKLAIRYAREIVPKLTIIPAIEEGPAYTRSYTSSYLEQKPLLEEISRLWKERMGTGTR